MMKKIIFILLLTLSVMYVQAQQKATLHGVMGYSHVSRVELIPITIYPLPRFGDGEVKPDRSYSFEVNLPGPMFCKVRFFNHDKRLITENYIIYIEPGKNVGLNLNKDRTFECHGDYAKENSGIKTFKYKLAFASFGKGVLKNPKYDDLKRIDAFQKQFADTLKQEKYSSDYIETWNKVIAYECDRARMKVWKEKDEKEYKKFLTELKKKNFTSTHVLSIEDWQYYLDNFFTELENMDLLPQTDVKYGNRVEWIKDPMVRSEYATYLLSKEINVKDWLTKPIDKMIDKYKEYITAEYSKPNLDNALVLYDRIKSDFNNINVGKEAPLFTFENVDGKMVSLKDFRGKYVILDFWNIYCGPCKKQIPFIKEMEKEFEEKNIYFISITCDPQDIKDKWLAFVKKNEMAGVQLIMDNGRHSAIMKDYQICGFPTFVLIAPDGKIINPYFNMPSDSDFKQNLKKSIEEYNKKS